MANSIEASLDALMSTLNSASTGQSLTTAYEPAWPSPCYQLPDTASLKEGDQVSWVPVRQDSGNNFSQLEDALEITLDNQFKTFFTRYFAFNIAASAPQGPCELLQVISDDDFARLQENLIGHILMKRRLRQPETLFFGLTDDDNLILCVKNETGEVVLERVGKKGEEIVADDLCTFLSALNVD
ncbi:SecY-interacting protein [Salinimonas sp. HHU 13199]|uniref:SecY-interacting protein n=1 Tax=Salinimonas profundi TaxID=2729140 RepID=A0ABR8LMV5_9ALTE|nr:SecY-interacting protein [Salinimonas profundi]MBD3585409.1 SecY-interacting protein [Salinimonas profundi]